MKHYFIVNPQARNGRGHQQLHQLFSELKRQGIRHDYALTHDLDHARALSQEANRSGYEIIVAVGGDGTINRVLNGFFDSHGRRISQARMGVVHTGTSPDFCRSYRIPTAMVPAVATLAHGIVRPKSVGRITFVDPGASVPGARLERRSSCFACCANIGLGASLARLANGGIRQYAGDFLGTLLSLLRILLRYRPRTLRIELDSQARTLERVYSVSVGKTFHIASGLKVNHALRDQDPRLFVLCVRNLTWARIGPVLRSLYSGRPIESTDCLSLDYARSVSLDSADEMVEVEFDGDPAGRCPCRLETAPDPLDLIVEAAA